MLCTLVGVKRGSFTNSDGDKVNYGHLFVVYDFEEITEDVAGQQANKVKFDYDGVGELLKLTYPVKADLQINLNGKCTKVVVSK